MHSNDISILARTLQAKARKIEICEDDQTLHEKGLAPTDDWHQARLLTAKLELIEAWQALVDALDEQISPPPCQHDVIPMEDPYDPVDEWFSEYVRCSKCTWRSYHWYCHTSPTKMCRYDDDSEYCVHCHMPSERK